MTCKQEFLVLENGESLLPCRVAASFPSWRAPSFILPGPLLIPANPSSNKRSLYLLAACLSSASLVFTSLQLDARWGLRGLRSLQPGNIGFSSSSFRARARTRERSARRTGPVALQCISGMPEIDFGVSDLPFRSRFRRGCTRDVFAHPRFGGSSSPSPRILPLKRIAKFTDALFNCIATHVAQPEQQSITAKDKIQIGIFR